MKTRHLTIASAVGALLLAASAQAVVIAGWDFSQHQLPGSAGGGGSPLLANYASLDPNGAGAESGYIGRAVYDDSVLLPTAGLGANCERSGSADTDGCAPPNVDGPVRSNRSEPFDLGLPSFDAFTILKNEGQDFATRYGMTATGDTSLVFEVIAGYAGGANAWAISLGGRMLTGTGPSTVGAEISSDGSSYVSCGSDTLTIDDEQVILTCPPGTYTNAFVRLNLDASAGQPVIDNVAIEATPIPEPAALAQLLSGAGCLIGLALRRRA